MPTITPHLWYAKDAEEAARFYVSLFPNSSIDAVSKTPSESPAGPPGSVVIVNFTLLGTKMMAMTAGPYEPFNHAISFMLTCDTQAEIDRYYDALLEGGVEEQCGWVRDRYGLSWQIVPRQLGELMGSPDRAAAKRASDAMLQMRKLNISALQAAFAGHG